MLNSNEAGQRLVSFVLHTCSAKDVILLKWDERLNTLVFSFAFQSLVMRLPHEKAGMLFFSL